MRKLFGEYLVEKKIVDTKTMVDVLVEQMESIPTVAQLVHQKQWLSPEQIFQTMGEHVRTGKEFKAVAESLKIWTGDLEGKLSAELNKVRIPIGQLLVKRGAIESKALIEALDEYLSEFGEQQVSKKSESPKEVETAAATSTPTPPTAESTPSAPAGGAPTFAEVEKESLGEYMSLLSDDRHAEMLQALAKLKEAKLPDASDDFEKVCRDFHVLKGAARFIRAQLTEKVVEGLEKKLEAVRANPDSLTGTVALAQETLDVVWKLRVSLFETSSEEAFWGVADLKGAYEACMAKLQ